MGSNDAHLVALGAQLGQQLVKQDHLAGRVDNSIDLGRGRAPGCLPQHHVVLQAPAQELHTAKTGIRVSTIVMHTPATAHNRGCTYRINMRI